MGRQNKKGNRVWKYAICGFFMFFLTGMFCNQNVYAADSVPVVEKSQIINNRDIEIYWSEDVEGAGWVESKNVNGKLVMQEQNYSVKVDGINIPIEYYYWEDYNSELKGVVYYNTRNSHYPKNPDYHKTTIRLSKPINDLKNLPEIEIKVKGDKINSKSGVFVPEQIITVNNYEPFYQKQITLECGVKILGTAKVREEAMTTAEAMMKVLLANEKIAQRMGQQGCMLGIYGEGEIAYDIPEHRFDYDENYLYVEGFGGTQLASIRDANVLRLKTGDYTTGYRDESILTHEFAHTVHTFGLSEAQQAELLRIYQSARNENKWDNSYAGSNEYEYFATLSAIWFNAMDDTFDGNWDGVRGPINTRAELKVYDKAAYDFLSTIYVSDQYLPSPWENGTVPDNNTFPGTEPEPDPTPEPKPDPTPEPKPDPTPEPKPDPTPEPEVKYYSVRFVYYNGKKDTVKTVKEGEKVTAPDAPGKKNYIFKGWYSGKKKYNFYSNLTSNITLRAKWEKVTVKNKVYVQSLKAKSGQKVLIKIKKIKGIEGYKVTYAKNAKFKKSVKTKFTKSVNLTVKNIKKGTWYFKVQAYRTDSKGNKIIGKPGKIKKITIKK